MWNLPLGATYWWYKNSLDLGTFGISDFWHGALSVNRCNELESHWRQESRLPSLREMSSSSCPSSPGPKDTLKQSVAKVHSRIQWFCWVPLQSLGEGLGYTNKVVNTPPTIQHTWQALPQDQEGFWPPLAFPVPTHSSPFPKPCVALLCGRSSKDSGEPVSYSTPVWVVGNR